MVRVITALIMAAAILAAVWWLPSGGFFALVFIAAISGIHEYSKMFFVDRVERLGTVAAGALVAATILFCPAGPEAVSVILAAVLFGISILFMWRAKELLGVANRMGLSVYGILYLGLAFAMWGSLRQMPFGRELVLFALVPACLCDTFAFIAGKTFGNRKFAPLVSPNKTMEGFFGALAGSIVGTFIVKFVLLSFVPWHTALLFAFVIWIVSPFGDLIESLLKRSCNVKDSGDLIPGHGGILDRLDALIFTAPAAYVFAKYVIGV